jgi:hypothetical protein
LELEIRQISRGGYINEISQLFWVLFLQARILFFLTVNSLAFDLSLPRPLASLGPLHYGPGDAFPEDLVVAAVLDAHLNRNRCSRKEYAETEQR